MLSSTSGAILRPTLGLGMAGRVSRWPMSPTVSTSFVRITGRRGSEAVKLEDVEMELACEPDNAHDPRAVKVLVQGLHVGYLSKRERPEVLQTHRTRGWSRADQGIHRMLAGRADRSTGAYSGRPSDPAAAVLVGLRPSSTFELLQQLGGLQSVSQGWSRMRSHRSATFIASLPYFAGRCAARASGDWRRPLPGGA
jgi:hypothetical protein